MASVAPTMAQAQQAAAAQAQANQAQMQGNLAYLRTAERHKAVCPPAAGSGVNQPWVAGQTLIYDVPTAQGGWLESFLVQVSATVNPATGTGATYALNKSAPWSLFDSIQIEYGSVQFRLRPYMIRILEMLRGFERPFPEQVASGQALASMNALVWGAPFALTTATNNPWTFWFRVPLRMLPRSPAGMLPIQGDSTRAQFKLICTSQLDGPDPLLAPVVGANTGHAVVGGGSVKVLAEYRDGINLPSTEPMHLDMRGVPTIQMYMDRQLNPLTAGTILRQRIDNKLQHLFAVSIVVDAQQSTEFALNSNLQALELDMDFAGQNAFWRYGVNGSNIGITEYFEEFRSGIYGIGQDLDQGVIPWVPGPFKYGSNPDNVEGTSYLNMMGGGWTDATYGLQVGATGAVAGVVPRVETYLVSINPVGLVRA